MEQNKIIQIMIIIITIIIDKKNYEKYIISQEKEREREKKTENWKLNK